jgi:N-acetylglucosaminyldiphosphoundecaprenol N-acetyl-beta-D-mannosaminyltransferase
MPSVGTIPRINVLGVGVSAIDVKLAVAEIEHWIAEGKREYVCVTGMHGVVESQSAASLREIHNRAGLVTPDGMPMVWLLWWHGHREADRVCGAELMAAVFEQGGRRGWRHFLYGAKPETLSRLEANLRQRVPDAKIVGRLSPPFRELTPDERVRIVDEINASGADIVWVGLSTPKQERWMAANRSQLRASALIGVGAAFDFHAGTVRQAPRFIQRSGFEWLYRLAAEPRRLWRRYATGVPIFLWWILLQKAGLRRYSLD